MADEVIDIVLNGRVDPKIVQGIRDIGLAAEKTDQSLDELRDALRQFSNIGNGLSAYTTDVKELRGEVQRAVKDQKALAEATRSTSQELVRAAASGKKFTDQIKDANRSSLNAGKSFTMLNGIVGNLVATFASFFAAQQWMAASDAMVSYENRLKVVGLEGQALDEVMGKISQTALRNGQSMDGLTQLYMKVATAQKDINASGAEMLSFLDAVAAGLRIQGGSAQAATGALLQLSQAIGASRVEAQEFNSIVEGMYPIAQAAAKGIDGFGGSVAKLQRFIREGGTITGEQLFRGVLDSLDELEGKVAKTQLTIGQSVQNLRTQFELWTKETQGSAALISNAINFIGKNLNTIIPIVAAFAGIWLTIQAVKVLSEIVGGLLTLVKAIQAGVAAVLLFVSPWALLAAVIIAAAVAVAYFTGNLDGVVEGIKKYTAQIFGAINEQTGLKDIMGEASATAETLKQSFSTMTSSVTSNTTAANDNKKALQDWSKSATTSIKAVASSYDQLTASAKAAAAAAGAAQFIKNDPGAGNTRTNNSFTTIGKGANNNGNSIRRFASGGSFMVGGKGGVDRNLVQFRASSKERVTIQTPAQQREEERARRRGGGNGGPPTFNFYIQTPDADSFRLSRNQIANGTFAAIA